MTEAQAKKQVIEQCFEDLSYFGKIISPQTFYLDSPEFHAELDEILLDRTKIQVVREAPRGTAKSTKIIAKIIHHGLFEDGDKLVVIQSKTRPEAINRLTKIKNIFEYSSAFKALFGYIGEQVAISWREDKVKVRVKNPLTGKVSTLTIKAIGTGQPTRGALEDDTRITLYILDDPDDEDNCLTKELMEKNFSKFLGGIAGLDRRNGRVIVIGTPIREGCIVERLRNAPGWDTKVYQSYWTDENSQIQVLWKEMYDYDWLMRKKSELEAVGMIRKFYSEYQCEIVGEEDQLFKAEYFRHWEGSLIKKEGDTYLKITSLNKVDFDEPVFKPVNVFLGVDPASSVKQTADYSVIMPVAVDSELNVYILPYFRKRVPPTQLADAIVDAIRTYSPKRGHIETTGFQEMLRQTVRYKLRNDNLILPGLERKFNPRTEKNTRLESLEPLFFQRKVYLGVQTEFEDELLSYPRGRHDDTIDAFYYATIKLIPPHHANDEREYSEDEKVLISRGKSISTSNWRIA